MSATTDSSSSSLHEVKVFAFNEPQNVDLNTERENIHQRAEKDKRRDVMLEKEIERICYEIQNKPTVTLKDLLKYLYGRYVLLQGHLYIEIFSQILRTGNT